METTSGAYYKSPIVSTTAPTTTPSSTPTNHTRKVAISASTLDAKEAKETLCYLYFGLLGGITEIIKHQSIQWNATDFSNLSRALLINLVERGNNNKVVIDANRFSFTIEEIDGIAFISVGKGKRALADTSLKELQKNFILDIIDYADHYPAETVNYAINHTLIAMKGVDPGVTRHAAKYLLKNLNRASKELQFSVANHVLQSNQNYKRHIIVQIMEMVLRNSENCDQMINRAAATHIITNITDYRAQSESIRCAALFVIYFPELFSYELFIQAASDVVKHSNDYPGRSVQIAALGFVEKNISFFEAPINNQHEFVSFFEKHNKMQELKDYSEKLKNAISAKHNVHEIYARGANGNVNLKHTVQIINVWRMRKFGCAISANIHLAYFLLKHAEHDALVIWQEEEKKKKKEEEENG